MADPTLAQLRMLVAVVRTGSLTAAAVELNITQSAVSHALNSLEQVLGVRLLERQVRGVHLTPAGLRLLPIARHILHETERLHAEVRAVTPLSGTVTVASFPSLALRLLPPVLERVRAEAPGIVVQIRDAYLERYAVEDAVLRAEADIGLTQLPAHSRLMARGIGHDPYDLITPAAWEMTSVWERPYIHLGPSTDDFVVQAFQQTGILLQPSMTLLSESVIVAMVGRGLGFALLPRLTLGEWTHDEWRTKALPNTVIRHFLPMAPSRAVGTVTRPGDLSPASRYLLGLIWAIRL